MAATHPSNPNNPQAEQMSDESMLRNLAAQAEAIWPQEQGLLDRYQLDRPAICDVGCGPVSCPSGSSIATRAPL
jgi:hypothetical protein